MFNALTANNHVISLLTNDVGPLPPGPYYCPVCRREVRYKNGSLRHPHFAHKIEEACHGQSEPESEDHLQAKLQLYEWLKRHQIQPNLERYYPSIRRRADLSFHVKGQHFVIEYQAADVSVQECAARTSDYRRLLIEPIWVWSSKRRRSFKHGEYSIHQSEWSTMRDTPSGRLIVLTYLDTAARSLQFLYPHATTSLSRSKASVEPYALASAFPSLLLQPPEPSFFLSVSKPQWLYQKQKWRFGRNHWRGKRDTAYLRSMFASNRSDIPFFPAEAGWPHLGMEALVSPPYVWQSWMLLYLQEHTKINQTFPASFVRHALSMCIEQGIFTERPFLYLPNRKEVMLEHYFHELKKVQLLIKERTHWKWGRPLYIPNSLNEAYERDKYWADRIW
ncbi:competence protein CoiA [Alteribacillus sp. HJP-4]|uniref:competence protein CoiA n=1 Tax=Alteribacillus sp. HJP-4 TaxID=2775394 RepID=UPI0035CCDB5B